MSSTSSRKKPRPAPKRRNVSSTSSDSASRQSSPARKRVRSDDEELVFGSDNAWADLGYPDAQERKVKADLAFEIRRRIESLGITQVDAAKTLGLSQPKVSQIVNLRTQGFSVERLAALLTRLGATVELKITYRNGAGSFRVKAA